MITDGDLFDIAAKEHIPLNGIFMKDTPPRSIKQGGYIINLQDESLGMGGSHWVAIYFPHNTKDHILYMDSFGFIPSQSTLNWIKACGGVYSGNRTVYSDTPIQNIASGGCGIYSLFFIDFINRHQRHISSEDLLRKWCKLWYPDVKKNLTRLKELAPYYKNSD